MDPIGPIGAVDPWIGASPAAAEGEMNFKRILCFFGKHKPSKPEDIRFPITPGQYFYRKLIFCERCKKILFIGILPPEHPNCLCTIFDPKKDNANLKT